MVEARDAYPPFPPPYPPMEATATFPIELRDQLARVFPPYTPLYCEENVLNLVSALESLSTSSLRLFLRSYGVFISNPQRSAALFFQNASKAMEEERWYVVWDYHVVVVVVGTEGERWVLDPDSRLGWCVRLEGECCTERSGEERYADGRELRG